jgi:regulator of sigma E protease
MTGEDEESDDPRAFCNKSVPRRMVIVIAGAVMNLILGFVLMMALVFSQGTLASNVIGRFDENAISAEKLLVGDEIVKVGRTRVHTWEETVYEIASQGYEPISMTVKRNGETVKVEDVSFGVMEDSGAVFGSCDFIPFAEERTFGNLMKHTFFRSVSTVKMVYDSLIGMVTGRFGLEAVSGPVGVAEVVGDAAKASVQQFLYIVAVLTINLGVFNLIPFPALDGGRILFLLIEAVSRKKINPKIEGYINFLGLMFMLLLAIFVTFNDVLRLF